MTSIIKKVKEERAQEMARKRGIVPTPKKFDVDAFDRKVAASIFRYHVESGEKTMENKYNKWCDKNIEHLEYMYELSGLPCDFDTFCLFTFNNS